MPSFLPRIAAIPRCLPSWPCAPGGARGQADQGRRAQPLLVAKASRRTQRCAVPRGASRGAWSRRQASIHLELDLDVDARRQRVQTLQRVDGFRRRLEDVDQPLMGADLEVLARVLVLERRADHAVDVFLGRQRHRTGDAGAGALGGLDDLFGSPIDGVVVVRLQSDSNFLCRDGGHFGAFSFFSYFALPRKEGGAPLWWGAAPV